MSMMNTLKRPIVKKTNKRLKKQSCGRKTMGE